SLLRARASGLLGGLGRRRARPGPGIHDALPGEDPALLDDEGLRRDVALDPAATGEVRLALDEDVALEAAGDAHVLRTDVGLHLRLLREHDVAVGVDLSLDLPVDPQVPGRHDVALQTSALADDGDPPVLAHLRVLSLRGGLLPRSTRVLPLRVFSPPDHRASPACSCSVIAW